MEFFNPLLSSKSQQVGNDLKFILSCFALKRSQIKNYANVLCFSLITIENLITVEEMLVSK